MIDGTDKAAVLTLDGMRQMRATGPARGAQRFV